MLLEPHRQAELRRALPAQHDIGCIAASTGQWNEHAAGLAQASQRLSGHAFNNAHVTRVLRKAN